jgi:hypothetical protein
LPRSSEIAKNSKYVNYKNPIIPQACREKISAPLRDKKYHQQEFLLGSDSGENAVKSFLRSRQCL